VQKRLYIVTAAIALLIVVAGCGGPELEKLTIQYDATTVIVEALFNETVSYSIMRDPDGESLTIRIDGATLAKNISRERLIEGSDLISGWFATETKDAVNLKLFLTDTYPFDHATVDMGSADDSPAFLVRLKIAPDEASLTAKADDATAESSLDDSPLARGIKYYREGSYDAALDQFRQALDDNGPLPLAYYYAARIRFDRGQRGRAEENLKQALADSAEFTEALGLLAHVQSLQGDGSHAAENWKLYTSNYSFKDDGERKLAAKITHPDSFNAILIALRQERAERKKLDVAERKNRLVQARQDSIKRADARKDSLKIAAVEAVEAAAAESEAETKTAAADSASSVISSASDSTLISGLTVIEEGSAGSDFDLEDFTRDLRSDIRRGIYGIAAAVALLLGGTLGVMYLVRRRRVRKEKLSFNEEVGQLLEEREEVAPEENLDSSMEDFREISRRIIEDNQTFGNDELEEPPPISPEPDRGGRGLTVGQAEEVISVPEPAQAVAGEEPPPHN